MAVEHVEHDLDHLGAAPVEQAVEGTRIVGSPACAQCKHDIPQGATCTVYAYRPAGEARWVIARLYCSTCDRRRIEHPSRTLFEALCRTRLASVSDVARQAHSACVLGVEALDLSPATDSDRSP